MYKKTLVLGFVFSLCGIYAFAEDITISTYYPSPYGSYSELEANQLQTNKIAIGDTNGDSLLNSSDQPTGDGQLYAARSVILKPQAFLPTTDLEIGEIVYNAPADSLYLYNGSAWVAASGGGPAVMRLACGWMLANAPSPYEDPSILCTPPSCPSGWTSEGTSIEPTATAYPGSYIIVGQVVNVCTK